MAVLPLVAAATAPVSLWPLAVLAIGVALVIGLITKAKMHPFFALMLAAVAAGMLSKVGTLPGEPQKSHWVQAVELATAELGTTAGKIGLVIALASIIGMCMSESGAADKVVRRFLAVFGEKRSALALLVASYILSIPIFFDTFFMLLVPIAQALALRTGRSYTLYVLAIIGGGVVTHSLIAPHPGPLAMAEILKVDLGFSIVVGLLLGIPSLLAMWFAAKRIAGRLDIPVRATERGGRDAAAMKRLAERPESELPGFFISLAPVVVPVLLIGLASAVAALPTWKASSPGTAALFEFVGNRNIALLIAAALGLGLLARRKRLGPTELGAAMGPPLETAGIIILITSAGGAFGYMLRNAGVGATIQGLVAGRAIDLVLLSWVVSATIRLAQGSATVAMLTTASMVEPLLGAGLPYHPMYVFAAIGFGGFFLSWMNDSGFWVVSQLSGFTERETLRSWTIVVTVGSVAGFLACLVFSRLLPLT